MKNEQPQFQHAVQSMGDAPPDVYQQLGQITRQLHDSLNQLGVLPGLQHAAQGLPDARSRLRFVAEKTGQAAHKVLGSVDRQGHRPGRPSP